MRNPKKISGTIFLRSIQKTEYGLAQVTLEGQKKMIPFLLTGLGRDVVEGAKFKGVLISQNCGGFPSDVITNVDVTSKPKANVKSSRARGKGVKRPSGVKMSTMRSGGKKKGTVDQIELSAKIVAQNITGVRYVSYQTGHWYVGEDVDFDPSTEIDPNTGFPIALNMTPSSFV